MLKKRVRRKALNNKMYPEYTLEQAINFFNIRRKNLRD